MLARGNLGKIGLLFRQKSGLRYKSKTSTWLTFIVVLGGRLGAEFVSAIRKLGDERRCEVKCYFVKPLSIRDFA